MSFSWIWSIVLLTNAALIYYAAWRAYTLGYRKGLQSGDDQLRAALKVTAQAIREFKHAQECGPDWYTRGERGMYQQVRMWLSKGLDAVREFENSVEQQPEKP